MSLVFPIRRGRILLGKKVARIGKGLFTGFGGKKRPNETIERCAIRELHEETGNITALEQDLHYHGVLRIHNPLYSKKYGILVVHIYIIRKWRGRARNTREMQPKYFTLDNIPYKTEMRKSEKHWLPDVLNGHHVDVNMTYDENEELESMTTIIRP